MKERTKSSGEVEIISVRHETNAFIVEWQNKANREIGTDYVSNQNGEIVKGETTVFNVIGSQIRCSLQIRLLLEVASTILESPKNF